MYYIYLDDERNPKINKQWKIARNGSDFRKLIKEWQSDKTDNQLECSLDHDLGEHTEDGYVLIKWMCEFLEQHNMPQDILDNVTINVHSANPIGKGNIEGYWKSFRRYLETQI